MHRQCPLQLWALVGAHAVLPSRYLYLLLHMPQRQELPCCVDVTRLDNTGTVQILDYWQRCLSLH